MNRKRYIAPSLQVMEVKPSDEIMDVNHNSQISNGGDSDGTQGQADSKQRTTSVSDPVFPSYDPWEE